MSSPSKIGTTKDFKTKPSTQLHTWTPFEEMERFFDRYFSRGRMKPFTSFEGKTPSIDVLDRDGEIIVKAEMPGVDKKDLDVSVTRNSVCIKGSTSHEEKEEGDDFYRCEISRGSYSRTISLPADINEDKVKVKYKNGLLELTMPKIEETKRRKIKID